MTDRLADELDSVWAEAREIFADAFHTDDYSIKRTVKTPDGYGGTTDTLVEVESGKCVLNVENQISGERQTPGGELLLTVSRYSAELPITSVVTTSDELDINERAFNVTDVKRGGHWGDFTYCDLEERS